MKTLSLILLAMAFTQVHAQQNQPHPSAVFEYRMLPVTTREMAEVRHLMNWPTKTLENFHVEQLDLKATESIELDDDKEMLVLVLNGALQLETDNSTEVMEERSIAWLPRNKNFKMAPQNSSASVYLIRWDVDGDANKVAVDRPEAKIFHYDAMDFQETAKGGRRAVMREETETLQELEMHITTLKEGEKSHDPHVHADEEIILVLQGHVAEHINGTEYQLGPGSLVFLSAYDPHGIRNVGEGECEYYAIRWITAKTGK
ncbi:cupin domain-containing protein [Cyclobacterium jeungdonense]|uniref:Cupin domain-containing protein n=1 Tax=Cyclobacterium jeungdonense TaxID=708087 RepID=A0ABT8CG09_9BACT|nr:cupin domain-containing protein [Cyclobacterium jeungdonense]MDN3690723.1 cupin domain-containing protein [Cyclobacterium jeungdonense]